MWRNWHTQQAQTLRPSGLRVQVSPCVPQVSGDGDVMAAYESVKLVDRDRNPTSHHKKCIYTKVGHRVPNNDSGWFDSRGSGEAAVLQATVA